MQQPSPVGTPVLSSLPTQAWPPPQPLPGHLSLSLLPSHSQLLMNTHTCASLQPPLLTQL